jgi:site-specific recombinase XerD
VVARRAHNPEVVGSNPTPATKQVTLSFEANSGIINPEMTNKVSGTTSGATSLNTILTALQTLSPKEKAQLVAVLQSGSQSLLGSPGEGMEDWQNALRLQGLSEGTVNLYSRTVKRVLAQYPSPTPRDIRNYLSERLKEVSPTKVRNDQKSLRSFFNFLQEEGLWLANPVAKMKLLKVAKVIRKAPEPEDVEKLLNAWSGPAHANRMKDRLIIALLVDTGLRITEACSIRAENIDLDGLQIKVMGKGKKERIVPISPVIVQKLQEYLRYHRTTEFLFPADNRLGYQSIRSTEKTFRRICKRLGIEPAITPHGLRHYFATASLRNGARLELISKILGHSSVGITADVYRTVKQDEIQAEHRKYSPLAKK